MKSDLDHLPPRQQDELDRVRTTLLAEFEAALTAGGGGTQAWRKCGKVLKIVLFGSYARSDWVDEPENGYQSDFDLLVVVSHPNLTDIADYWWTAEDKILRDPTIGRTVNLIVHTLAEVNQALLRGEAFWTDIIRDGIILHELPGHPFARSQPMTPAESAKIAERHYAHKAGDVVRWIETAQFQIDRAAIDSGFRKLAAFSLHQTAEAAYICCLLVLTYYSPRSHNIKFLRSLAEDADQRLVSAWPRYTRADRRRFELLKRAYVEARYSDQFEISREDLVALAETCARLRDLVEALGRERVEQLRHAADLLPNAPR